MNLPRFSLDYIVSFSDINRGFKTHINSVCHEPATFLIDAQFEIHDASYCKAPQVQFLEEEDNQSRQQINKKKYCV